MLRAAHPLSPGPAAGIPLLPALAFALAAAAVWLASHEYLGIRHDAIFYSFLALLRLHPESLSGDLFVRFGSQDAFTVFSPLYAFVMARLDLEGGALWLATLGQLCFWSAAAALLSQLLPGPRRWLALAILAAWPGAYGAQDVFSYAEYFVSPRAYAEAAVMAALAAHFAGRLPLAVVALALAFAFHPIMALPGAIAVLALRMPLRTLGRVALPGAAGLALVLLVSRLMPFGPIAALDPEWLAIVRERSPYLFPDLWGLLDWQRAGVPAAALALGALAFEAGRLREFSRCALLVGFAGVALAWVVASLVPVVIGVQGQAWRWLWITKLAAVIITVPLAQVLWARRGAARAALVLLGVGWLGSEDSLGLVAALLAVGLGVLALPSSGAAPSRAVALAGWMLAALLAIAVGAVTTLWDRAGLAAAVAVLWTVTLGPWGDGAANLPGSAHVSALAGAGAAPRFAVSAALALACALGLALVLRDRIERPDAIRFTPAALQAFEAWRARIGPTSTVLWAQSGIGPWFLLNRRAYISPSQTVGVVFTRAGALEMARRARAIAAYQDPQANLGWRPTRQFEPQLTPALAVQLCNLPELDFIVRDRNPPFRASDNTVGGVLEDYELVDCRRIRSNAS